MQRSFAFVALALLAAGAFAQKRYEPTTMWPYRYEDFTPGVIYYKSNAKSSGTLNVHLIASELHYLKGDKIFCAQPGDIVRVEVGDEAYLYVDRQLMQIVARSQERLLLRLCKADLSRFLSGSGAYGSSAVTHSQKELSSLGIQIGGTDITSHGLLLQGRAEGQTLDVETTYYFVIDGVTVEATKKNVEKFVAPERMKEWKAFLKVKKPKWNREESLTELLHFFD